MNRNEQIEVIRKSCIGANPEIERKYPYLGGEYSEGRPIRLADVLLEMGHRKSGTSYFIDPDGYFHEWFSLKGRLDLRSTVQWNLKKDSLTEQSDQTISFLSDLLTPKD